MSVGTNIEQVLDDLEREIAFAQPDSPDRHEQLWAGLVHDLHARIVQYYRDLNERQPALLQKEEK